MSTRSSIAILEGKEVRRVWNEADEKWYFAVTDIVDIATASYDVNQYIKRMRQRDPELAKAWSKLVIPLFIETDGGRQKINCANTEGILRIVQAIPSPKVEPIKRWLARIGYERIEEVKYPELAMERVRELYKAKGYPDAWIEKRLQSIAVRGELTDEWRARGIKEGSEFSILTSEIAKGTFDLTPADHKEVKGLAKAENLRDHMSSLELVFTMLGEVSTTQIARKEDAQGFIPNRKAAKKGGKIAGDARKALELETGQSVVSSDNFLPEAPKKKKLNKKASQV